MVFVLLTSDLFIRTQSHVINLAEIFLFKIFYIGYTDVFAPNYAPCDIMNYNPSL